jgi:hypothetical protein
MSDGGEMTREELRELGRLSAILVAGVGSAGGAALAVSGSLLVAAAAAVVAFGVFAGQPRVAWGAPYAMFTAGLLAFAVAVWLLVLSMIQVASGGDVQFEPWWLLWFLAGLALTIGATAGKAEVSRRWFAREATRG